MPLIRNGHIVPAAGWETCKERHTCAKTAFLQTLMNAAGDTRSLPRIDVRAEQQLAASGN